VRPRDKEQNQVRGSRVGLYRAHPHLFHVLGLLFVVAWAYGPTLSFDFVWDDHLLIVGNQRIQPGDWHGTFARSFWDLHDAEDKSRSFYRPVISISYMIDRAAWGLNPQGFHLTNLVIYAICTLLVYAVCQALLDDPMAAFLGALVYAVLPVHVENVAWISGRTDLFCAAFYLAAYLFFLSWMRSENKPRYLIILSTGAYLLALLSKEMAITLPFLLLATWWLLEREALPFRRLLAHLVPYLAITVVYLGMRSRVLGGVIDAPAFGTLAERVASMAMVFTKYVGLLLLIVSPDPHQPDQAVENPVALASLAYMAITAVFLVWLARRTRRRDLVAYAALWFVVTLLPVFNLGAFGDVLFADRFLNLPSVGWALLIGLVGIKARTTPSTAARIALVAGVGTYLVLCGMSLRSNLGYWSTDVELFSRALQTSPNSAYVNMNLGRGLRASGEYDLALELYDRALELDPDDALIYLNKGVALEHAGRTTEALRSYQAAFRRDYRGHTLFYNIGNVLKQMGRCSDAVGAYEQALELRDDYRAHNNLGECLLALGHLEAAERQFRLGLEMNTSRIGCNNLGIALMMQGKDEEAITYFRKAIDLDPEALSPRFNLARMLYLRDELDEAGSHARIALEALSQRPDRGRSWPYADRLVRLDAQIRTASGRP